MQLTQRQCFAPAALGQLTRWGIAARRLPAPRRAPCEPTQPSQCLWHPRRAPSYSCRRCRRLPPPPAAAAAPCKTGCRRRLAMSRLPPSCPSLSPPAGAGELCRPPALPPCLAGATRTMRRRRRRRSSSGAAAAGSSQRHGCCAVVLLAASSCRKLATCCPLMRQASSAESVAAACTGQLCANCVLAGLQCHPCRRKQQEVLQRRRSNSWQAEVKERRAEVSRYMQDPAYKKQVRSTAEAGCSAGKLGCRSVDDMQLCTATRHRQSRATVQACPPGLLQVDEEKRARFKARKEQEVRWSSLCLGGGI